MGLVANKRDLSREDGTWRPSDEAVGIMGASRLCREERPPGLRGTGPLAGPLWGLSGLSEEGVCTWSSELGWQQGGGLHTEGEYED